MNATWELIKRHKGKVIAGGVIVGGALAYSLHATEAKSSFAYPHHENDELKAQARRHYVFDTNHRSCDQSILDLVPSIKQLLQARFDVDALVRKIQTEQLSSSEKLETWQRVKIAAFSRLVSQAYAYSILTVTLKAQISILAAEICAQFEKPASGFASSWLPKQITSLFSNEATLKLKNANGLDNNSRQVFLQCIQFFTTKGIYYLFDLVEAAVDDELKYISLKDKVDRKVMRELLEKVEKRVEEGFPASIIEMVAPLTGQECPSPDGIVRLLKRLIAVIESPWCRDTVSSLVDFYFSAACHKVPETPTPLATALPSFADGFEAVASNTFDSPLQNTLLSSDVHLFASNVFKMLD